MLSRIRRGRWPRPARKDGRPEARGPASGFDEDDAPPAESAPAGVGWDLGEPNTGGSQPGAAGREDLRAQILSLLADPRLDGVTTLSAARALGRPLLDVETSMDAMVQAGELTRSGGANKHYRVSPADKQRLEAMFTDAAHELGEAGVLAPTLGPSEEAAFDDEAEEPRLPITAGLLSLFLPGTGQLLNGDVGRASLVFAVWSLAWITHLSPVWTFVCLYAGAEALLTAKIRGMERKLAKEAIGPGANDAPRQLPPAKPSET